MKNSPIIQFVILLFISYIMSCNSSNDSRNINEDIKKRKKDSDKIKDEINKEEGVIDIGFQGPNFCMILTNKQLICFDHENNIFFKPFENELFALVEGASEACGITTAGKLRCWSNREKDVNPNSVKLWSEFKNSLPTDNAVSFKTSSGSLAMATFSAVCAIDNSGKVHCYYGSTVAADFNSLPPKYQFPTSMETFEKISGNFTKVFCGTLSNKTPKCFGPYIGAFTANNIEEILVNDTFRYGGTVLLKRLADNSLEFEGDPKFPAAATLQKEFGILKAKSIAATEKLACIIKMDDSLHCTSLHDKPLKNLPQSAMKFKKVKMGQNAHYLAAITDQNKIILVGEESEQLPPVPKEFQP